MIRDTQRMIHDTQDRGIVNGRPSDKGCRTDRMFQRSLVHCELCFVGNGGIGPKESVGNWELIPLFPTKHQFLRSPLASALGSLLIGSCVAHVAQGGVHNVSQLRGIHLPHRQAFPLEDLEETSLRHRSVEGVHHQGNHLLQTSHIHECR